MSSWCAIFENHTYLHSSSRSNAAQNRSCKSQPTLFPLAVMDRVLCLPQRTVGAAVGKILWVKLEPAMQNKYEKSTTQLSHSEPILYILTDTVQCSSDPLSSIGQNMQHVLTGKFKLLL